ncbi:DNA primase large subunit Spp2 [Recurvomyces mirabilis]|nr:DNA primase large subunit Spp2 [Recurvomyces mirabilis]
MSGKISLALGGPKKPNGKPAPTNGVKRSHAALHEDDDNDLDHGREQTVSHFDRSAGGAIDERVKAAEKGPLVIAPQANRDWRDASKRKRQRNGLPVEARNGGQSVEDAAVREKELEALKPGFGLNVTKRATSDGAGTTEGHDAPAEAEAAQQQSAEQDVEAPAKQKTDDELAMDALLGNTTKPELVLPAVSEEQAYNSSIQSAPSGPTLSDYDRVPVEEFGAGLLRGMGWVEGQGIGSQKGRKLEKTKVPARRPALLGIGAKEEAAVAQEMGVWGKAAAKKGGEVKVYNPVLLRDKRTGEMFTEEEAQKRKEGEERKSYVEEFERKEREREREKEREEKGRRRGEEDDRERGQERRRREKEDPDSRDRRGDKERDRNHDRDRRRRDDSEDEYQRRKEKERRRRDRDREDDRSRERSRRHDGDRDRDRHSHRHR